VAFIQARILISPACFNCKHRHYKCFFTSHGLDILSLMQSVANCLVGEYDFRNLCKLDPGKQIANFHRCVVRSQIIPVSQDKQAYVFNDLVGSTFLYHQVRHIMAVLFRVLVGTGVEQPSIISALMNVSPAESNSSTDKTSATEQSPRRILSWLHHNSGASDNASTFPVLRLMYFCRCCRERYLIGGFLKRVGSFRKKCGAQNLFFRAWRYDPYKHSLMRSQTTCDSHIDQAHLDLLRRCLSMRTESRPSIEEVLRSVLVQRFGGKLSSSIFAAIELIETLQCY
jgi:hypothetical protein